MYSMVFEIKDIVITINLFIYCTLSATFSYDSTKLKENKYIAITSTDTNNWDDFNNFCISEFGTSLATFTNYEEYREGSPGNWGANNPDDAFYFGLYVDDGTNTINWAEGGCQFDINTEYAPYNDINIYLNDNNKDCIYALTDFPYWTKVSCDTVSITTGVCNVVNQGICRKDIDCSIGCTNTDKCYNDLGSSENDIFGCYGTFSGGMDDPSVDLLCADGYEVCDSAQDAVDLGLTEDKCTSVGNNEIFLAREGGTTCDSLSGKTNTINNVWGCSGGVSDNSIFYQNECTYAQDSQWPSAKCIGLTHICTYYPYGDYRDIDSYTTILDRGTNRYREYINIELKNQDYGGVLCCKK